MRLRGGDRGAEWKAEEEISTRSVQDTSGEIPLTEESRAVPQALRDIGNPEEMGGREDAKPGSQRFAGSEEENSQNRPRCLCYHVLDRDLLQHHFRAFFGLENAVQGSE